MSLDDWARVTELVNGALDVPEAERRAWIDAHASDDTALAAEVARLVAAHQKAGGFLDEPLVARRDALPVLSPGQRIGSFVVNAPLGSGGMGEVWRARDASLGRDVAIKILPAPYSGNAERLRRFEQEARAAGQLNHPNVLTVHAVGTEAGRPYLVTELLEGETLKQRLETGPLPALKAVELAKQMALGLAAAHDRGIVHRDLKPANLFVTTDGRLKILDFGLVKLTEPASDAVAAASSTPGLILGTVGYMAPEQVRGREVDHRADLFAFGAVLFEMLTGRRAFNGGSPIETMNQILTADPPPLDGVAPGLARVVQHCLEKQPGERFQSARDLAFHLEAALSSTDDRNATNGARLFSTPGAGALRRWLPWALAGAELVLALVGLLRRDSGGAPAADSVRQFALSMAATPVHIVEWPPLAVSPDGRRLAYVTRNDGGVRIVVRDLDSLRERAIPGTEDGFAPFFSPDAEQLGFFTSEGIMRVAIAGGPPVRLTATSPVSRGAVWAPDGHIYFSPSQSVGISRLAAEGGVAEAVTHVDAASRELGHVWPDVAPGGEFLVYIARGDRFAGARVMARSLRTGIQRTIAEGPTYARAAPGGRIVFARNEAIYAMDIDPVTLVPRGPARPVVRGVQMDPLTGASYFATAGDGTLVYAAGDARPVGRTLLWVTPDGSESPAFPEERAFLQPAVSPDGTAVAVTTEEGDQDIWRFEVGQRVLARLTSHTSEDFGPVWSPDGRRIAFTSVQQGKGPAVFVKPADRVDGETFVVDQAFPNAWAGATDTLVVTTETNDGGLNTIGLSLAALAGGLMPGLQTARNGAYAATRSPDDRHLAFVSIENGRPEVFVARADGSGARQVSERGGTSPVWARDSRQLFFRSGDLVMAVRVGAQTPPELSVPRLLFSGRFEEPARHDWPRNYDVAPDGRFLMIRQTYSPAVRELVLVFGWRGQTLSTPRP